MSISKFKIAIGQAKSDIIYSDDIKTDRISSLTPGENIIIDAEIKFDEMTANRLAGFSTSKLLESTDLIDWVDAVTNQTTVSDVGDGTITLGTPQNIHTSCDFTCDSITANSSATINLADDERFLINGRTIPRMITMGAIRHEHTCGIDGTRAIHFDVRPDGYDDTKGIVCKFDLEGGSDNITIQSLNLDVDIIGATNAQIQGLQISKVGQIGSGMDLRGISIREGWEALHQFSGILENVEVAFIYDGSWTDVTSDFNSTLSNVEMFSNDNDYIYIGDTNYFTEIEFYLDTVASGGGIRPIFEYSLGAGLWNTLPRTDNSNGFRENGDVLFDIQPDWAVDTVNAVANKYWIRIQRTANSLSTPPIESQVKKSGTIEYSWDEYGDIHVRHIIPSGNLTMAGSILVDTVNEYTSNTGVSISGITLDDETGTKKVFNIPTGFTYEFRINDVKVFEILAN